MNKIANAEIRALYFAPSFVQAELTPRRGVDRSHSQALLVRSQELTFEMFDAAAEIDAGGRDLIGEVEG